MQERNPATTVNSPVGTNVNCRVGTPPVAWPKAGRAIDEMDETVGVNRVTGKVAMLVPLSTVPGRRDAGRVRFSNHGADTDGRGSGFIHGSRVVSITRTTAILSPRSFHEDDSGIFALGGAEDLVPRWVRNAYGKWGPGKYHARLVNERTCHVCRRRPHAEEE